MAKKNEFVFNIGFNRENPDHVKVVRILNQKGRGKAEYLAKAVLSYETGGETVITGTGGSIDYRMLEGLVRQILIEQRETNTREYGGMESAQHPPASRLEDNMMVAGEDVEGIMQVLNGFRK